MSRQLAVFISHALHPILMPFYAALLILNLNTYISYSISLQVQRVIISLVFITTAALPVVTAVLLLQKGIIKSLQMDSIVERRIPFLTTALYYFVCYYLLMQLPVPRMLSIMVLAAAITILIAFVVSFRWKISIHSIGAGGMTGLLFGFSQILNANLLSLIIVSILFSGILGWSRLELGAHRPNQIYLGFVIGFFTEWIMLIALSA